MKVSVYPELDLGYEVRPVVTLGNFDGVHLGHQRIMALLVERGAALHAPAVAVTFEPHPISVLRPDVAPKRILTPEQKREVLGKLGIDLLVIIEFTLEFSRKDPKEFIREVLFERLHASELVLGTNFRFGHGRAGDLETLTSLGIDFGFEVRRAEPALSGGEMISSSRIRGALADGRVTEAAVMLGRPYFLDGTVVHGDGRGKRMGFPTANLEVVGDVLLADGVYATSVRLEGRLYRGMAHIGERPTFGLSSRAVETHLFEFSEEVYQKPLRLLFHQRLRGTIAFDGPEALRKQLVRDRDQARAFFRGSGRSLVL
jgi:riboflavin kinase/FMN adenylyltransferase